MTTRSNAIKMALALAAALAFVLVSVAWATACETPVLRGELREPEIFSTRAHIAVLAFYGNAASFPPVTWRSEYAPAESNGEPPAANSPAWMASSAETTHADVLEPFLGEVDSNLAGTFVHHLFPETHYFARFHAENLECHLAAEETVRFTTKPVTKPEVASGSRGESTSFKIVAGSLTPTSARFTAEIESNGAQAEYWFEYAPFETGPWSTFTSGGVGTITVAEDFSDPVATLTGLSPETTYFVRIRMRNEKGEVEQATFAMPGGGSKSFTTPTARPIVGKPVVRNVTGDSAHVQASLLPHGSQTEWRFETAPSKSGPWTPAPGAAGTVTQAEAEALPENYTANGIEGALSGLEPAKTYYVRLFAANAYGEGKNFSGEPISTETGGIASFTTSGPPSATTFATHALHDETVRLLGDVVPNSVPTSEEQVVTLEGTSTGGTFTLTFEGETTAAIPFDASGESVAQALKELPKIGGGVQVGGRDGGPYTVYFGNGALLERNVPQMTADGSLLQGGGPVTVATSVQGGEAYDTHYHFEYVSQSQFARDGFAKAVSTPQLDAGSGDSPKFAGQDLTGLQSGETYRYRLMATNTSPGEPVAFSGEQSLTAPSPAASSPAEACSNQASRTGPSSNLPDCRAYEQVTPVDKEGSQEIFRWDGLKAPAYALIGELGGHVMVEAPVTWSPATGETPYLFSRAEVQGPVHEWRMLTGTAQPGAGVDTYAFQVFSPGMDEVGLEAFASHQSKEVEYRVGPFGGPYTTVATVPRTQRGEQAGWVAASRDFSKLVLQVEDHRLVEPKTTTKNEAGRYDLYEYVAGALRQVNVGVGSCGAKIASGHEETGGGHAVSNDGSRVFFEAVPGNNCGEPSHVFVRIGGRETADLGAYHFAAANSDGSEALLESAESGKAGLYLYRADSGTAQLLAGSASIVGAKYTVATDLDAVYFVSPEQLAEAPAPSSENTYISDTVNIYRYDITGQELSFVAQSEENEAMAHMSADGRYYYFVSRHVGAVPAGASVPGGGTEIRTATEPLASMPTAQVFRYDSVERDIECISCSSSFDPEPKLGANFGTDDNAQGAGPENGVPGLTVASSNGDYAFFQTPAALVPADVDGEVTPEGDVGLGLEDPSLDNSASGDVYEWRRHGVGGCAQLDGCLALITNGRGGRLNLLLGSSEEGRQVFIYTSSRLVPQDKDAAGDVYDAAIGGGGPPLPLRPVECEADECSTPAPTPLDATPSSLTFTGAGNVVAQPAGGATAREGMPPNRKDKKRKKAKRNKLKGKRRKAKTGARSQRSGKAPAGRRG